jgi:uncharacterized membrane protein
MQGKLNQTIANLTTNVSFNSDPVDMSGVENFTIQAKWTVPAAIVFAPTDIVVLTNIITKTAHGLITGTEGIFTTATTLPTGIAPATPYYIVKLTDNTFKISDTKAHALAGTDIIDITDQGVGNHTFTPTTLAVSIQPQTSNEPSTVGWISYGTPTAATGAGNVSWDIPTDSKYSRLAVTWTAGQVTFLAVDAGQG